MALRKKVYSDYRKHRWDMGDKILMFYQYFDNIKCVMFDSNKYESYYIYNSLYSFSKN